MRASDALERLIAGNRRFAARLARGSRASIPLRPAVEEQRPIAVVVGCSDSRVPVEIVFDQGPGDLFVIRVAGNIIAPSQIGSVEFAAEAFGTRLVVVLGHTGCGAVRATIDELQRPAAARSPNIASIVDRIRPAVSSLLRSEVAFDDAELMEHAVRANIRAGVSALRHGSDILERLVAEDGLVVAGAEYALESGTVQLVDGIPGEG